MPPVGRGGGGVFFFFFFSLRFGSYRSDAINSRQLRGRRMRGYTSWFAMSIQGALRGPSFMSKRPWRRVSDPANDRSSHTSAIGESASASAACTYRALAGSDQKGKRLPVGRKRSTSYRERSRAAANGSRPKDPVAPDAENSSKTSGVFYGDHRIKQSYGLALERSILLGRRQTRRSKTFAGHAAATEFAASKNQSKKRRLRLPNTTGSPARPEEEASPLEGSEDGIPATMLDLVQNWRCLRRSVARSSATRGPPDHPQ